MATPQIIIIMALLTRTYFITTTIIIINEFNQFESPQSQSWSILGRWKQNYAPRPLPFFRNLSSQKMLLCFELKWQWWAWPGWSWCHCIGVTMLVMMLNMLVLTTMELMSLSWPVNVWMQWEPLMSHSLADASQAPDTKVFWANTMLIVNHCCQTFEKSIWTEVLGDCTKSKICLNIIG